VCARERERDVETETDINRRRHTDTETVTESLGMCERETINDIYIHVCVCTGCLDICVLQYIVGCVVWCGVVLYVVRCGMVCGVVW